MDLKHSIRLMDAIAYAYLDLNKRVERYIGSSLYDMNVSLEAESPTEITISGVIHKGNQLRCSEKRSFQVERAAEILLFLSEVTGRVLDSSHIKHPERTLAQTAIAFSRRHGYKSLSENLRTSIQYPTKSMYSQVIVDEDITDYLCRKEGSRDAVCGCDVVNAPFGTVLRHTVFNPVLRPMMVDEESQNYIGLKAAIGKLDPGIPCLDHGEFASYLMMTSKMTESGRRIGNVFYPVLDSQSLLFREGEGVSKLVLIEPYSGIEILRGMSPGGVNERFYEIGSLSGVRVMRISTTTRLDDSELRIISSRHGDWMEGAVAVVVRGSIEIDADRLRDIMANCSRVDVIDAMEMGSLPTILFPSFKKAKELSTVAFDVPEKDLAIRLIKRFMSKDLRDEKTDPIRTRRCFR